MVGKLIIQDGFQREIDVFGLLPNAVVISECKGYNQQVSKEEIEIWLGEKIPIIRKWILDQPSISEREIIFEFWSTGGFTPDAKEILEKRKNSTKKYKIEFYDLDAMIEKSERIKSKKFTEILREYYLKEI